MRKILKSILSIGLSACSLLIFIFFTFSQFLSPVYPISVRLHICCVLLIAIVAIINAFIDRRLIKKGMSKSILIIEVLVRTGIAVLFILFLVTYVGRFSGSDWIWIMLSFITFVTPGVLSIKAISD